MSCSSADDFFFTLTPCARASCGSFASASATRFCTLTVLMSGAVPTAKLTFSV